MDASLLITIICVLSAILLMLMVYLEIFFGIRLREKIQNARKASFKSKAISVGLVLFALMGLFPPWMETQGSAGYAFIFFPPKPHYTMGVKLDIVRLMVQWVLVIGVIGGIMLIKGKNNHERRRL